MLPALLTSIIFIRKASLITKFIKTSKQIISYKLLHVNSAQTDAMGALVKKKIINQGYIYQQVSKEKGFKFSAKPILKCYGVLLTQAPVLPLGFVFSPPQS